ncbi:MAG: phosphatase PAP2 family protein [Gemmobacter sp.]
MFASHTTVSAVEGRGRILLAAIRDNGWLVALVAVHLALAFTFSHAFQLDFNSFVLRAAGGRMGELMPVFMLSLLLWQRFRILQGGGDTSLGRLATELRETLTDWPRMFRGLVALGAISLFCATFSFFKSVIQLLQPFWLDETFAEWDRIVHFGHDPYALLMPLIEMPWAVSFINGAYHFWAVLLFFVVFIACFTGVNPRARAAFLVAFVLVWALGGNMLATVLSSAGPVYYERLGYGDAFVPLMATLEASHEISPVWALGVQELLWSGYNPNAAGYGISAMPSMHVASSTLLALYAFTWARLAGWLLTGFAALIMLGSVVLGWHYAIDGYFGALIAWGCWRLALRVTGPRQAAG